MNKYLPKILIIDDVYGNNKKKKERRNFCLKLGIKEATADSFVDEPIAEAVFCRGQIEKNGKVINDLESTLQIVRDGWGKWPCWTLILLDLHFDTGNPEDREPQNYFGLQILKELYKEKNLRDIPVIILSAMDREQIEKVFADHGVFDFVDKTDMDSEVLESLLFAHGLLEEEQIVGHSISFLKCLKEARLRAVAGNQNILVQGETGTGKELLAHYIHQKSGRKGAFNPLFTQGVPNTLIEDRLFGHVRGAFDGASTDQIGAAEKAHKGTFFIDEFGNIPSFIQEKLLRLLDKNTREVQRLGSQNWKRLDLLIVLATNEMEILKLEDFRSDLLWRVEAHDPIILPPLRKRREDIPALSRHFLNVFEENHKADHRQISPEAESLLLEYDWPGNIRELAQVIEKAIYKYKGLRVLSASHLEIEKNVSNKMFVPDILQQEKKFFNSTKSKQTDTNIETVIEVLKNFNFDSTKNIETLRGKLWEVNEAYHVFIARYLKIALEENKRRYDDKIELTPAMKWATGDLNMSTTEANRLFKNLIKIAEKPVKYLLKSDPVLRNIAIDLKILKED